jgi:hypothetical protein
MKLALRTQPASDAKWLDKAAHEVIKARLVTRYPHAGIVIGDTLYHATAKRGLHASEYTPERWTLIDVGDALDGFALDLFASAEGAKYDWFSLLAFVGLKARDSRRYYCYEWVYHCMTGEHPTQRVTPETLLEVALKGPQK